MTKVTAWSLGYAMSTMVVKEWHLWLCLADIRETDKIWFINAPVSQTLLGDTVENFAQQFSTAQKQTDAIKHILPPRAAAASTWPLMAAAQSALRQGRSHDTAPSGTQILDERAVSSISGSLEELWTGQSHSPSFLASEQMWAFRECDRMYYSRTLCPNAGKFCKHADPTSDQLREAWVGSLHSFSLPHCGNVSGSVGATFPFLGAWLALSSPSRWLLQTITLSYVI